MAEKKSNKTFQNDVIARQGNLWFFKTEYRGANNNVTAVCRLYGHIISRNAQLYYNHDCPECSNLKRGKLKRSTSLEQLKTIVKTKGGSLEGARFEDGIWQIEVVCAAGHKFKPNLSSIKTGSWCPECSTMRSERLTRAILEKALQLKLPRRRPELLRNPLTGHNLEFDGYNEMHKVAFEYDGGGHKNKTHFYYNKLIIWRDAFKNKKADEHLITLLNITNHSNYKTLSEVISHVLSFVPNQLIKSKVSEYDIQESEVMLPETYKRMRDAAAYAGQSLLDNVYRGSSALYQLSCKNPEHSNYYVPGFGISDRRETWCPNCAGKTISQRIDVCKALIEKRAGIFIKSTGESLSDLEIIYKCSRGHNCQQKSFHILSGHTCDYCYKKSLNVKAYDDLVTLTKEKGCNLLSNNYRGKNTNHRFECDLCKEEYTATPHNLRQAAGNSCPNHREKQNSNLKARNTLDNMKDTLIKYIQSVGGKLEYILGNDSYRLKAFYQCKYKHSCSVLYSQINKRKTACTLCEQDANRKVKEDKQLQKLNIIRAGSYFGWNVITTYKCVICGKPFWTTPRSFSVKRKECCQEPPSFACY